MQINEAIQKYLRTGSGSEDWASAVETEKGVTYLRYDGIRIGNLSDSSGGVALQFMWRGAQVAWTRFDGAKLEGIKYHSLAGVAGRVKISDI